MNKSPCSLHFVPAQLKCWLRWRGNAEVLLTFSKNDVRNFRKNSPSPVICRAESRCGSLMQAWCRLQLSLITCKHLKISVLFNNKVPFYSDIVKNTFVVCRKLWASTTTGPAGSRCVCLFLCVFNTGYYQAAVTDIFSPSLLTILF